MDYEIVLGYKDGVPYFARAGEVDKLGEAGRLSLAAYLPGREDKITVHAKPSDVRAIERLIEERQINAENVRIIEIPAEEFIPEAGTFEAEIEKCKLCYACRGACFGCYCKVCFMERGSPNWHPPDIDKAAKITYHLTRAMHLAGRCVTCGACEAACSYGVKLAYIYGGEL